MGLPNEGYCGKWREPRAAMGGGRRTRGGLCTGRDREGRSLERWRKVWRCSPLRELDRDGLSEEIDDGV